MVGGDAGPRRESITFHQLALQLRKAPSTCGPLGDKPTGACGERNQPSQDAG